MTSEDAPGFDVDDVREHVRLNPSASAVEVCARLGIDPANVDAVRALVEGEFVEFSEETGRARDAVGKLDDRESDTVETVTNPNRNDPVGGVRHTPDSISNESNTPDGSDPADAVDGAGDGGTDDNTHDRRLNTHNPAESPDDTPEDTQTTDENPGFETVKPWDGVDFSTTTAGTYPSPHHSREQWMGRQSKLPFAPWGDRNADLGCTHTHCPEHDDETPADVVDSCPDCRAHQDGTTTAECDHDARYKWGHRGHYVDGDTVAIAEDDPRLDGRVFIQHDADPFAFVDGDDVRCPETGDVHPAFVDVLDALGLTYADVSTSGAGVHAYYTGDLPNDMGQAVFQIDTEPWGENDDPPTVEIYANKHVCVATGDHIDGTPDAAAEWDDDGLRAVLDEYDALDDPSETVDHDTDRDLDLGDYEPSATGRDETTDDVRDVLRAVDRLTPSDLPLRTSKVGSDGTGWEKWDPSSYRTSSGGDSLHREPGTGVFHDHKHGKSFGVLSLYAAEQGIISKPWDRLAGNDWWDAVDTARDGGAPIPKLERGSAEPSAPIPHAALEHLTDDAAERWRRKHDLDVPSTKDARRRLRDALLREIRAGNTTLLDAPTALGKSHTVATEPWLRRTDVTGDAPVVHLHATRDARDEAARDTETDGGDGAVLRGRREASPLARGDHDPVDPDAGDDRGCDPDPVVTVDGLPASEWFDRMCDDRGLPFSTALALARERNDQGLDDLPPVGSEDPAVAQWDGLPRDDGHPAVDVIHATHQFAYVPSLRAHTNVVLDEQPDFSVDLGQDRIRRMVTAYLKQIDAPVSTFETFVALGRFDHGGADSDAGREQDALDDVLLDGAPTPPREWFVDDPDAHALAPDLTRALWRALRFEDTDANGRRAAKVLHEPPRFDAGDDGGYGGTWLSVVIDEDNTVRSVRNTPDFSNARSVIGLDAHPARPMWDLNAAPGMDYDAVLDPTERRLWRRFERGLTVVQVGDATRPRSGDKAREWMNPDRVGAVLDRLTDAYGDALSTAITTAQVEDDVRRLLADAGIRGVTRDSTMHYGEEKSRNDFADETVGYLYGCMDPGDDMVLDALAELGKDAAPSTERDDDGELHRAKGRGFDGPDADTAAALLASVRENHVAQAAGRYARRPDDPDSQAVVYVHTDATPADLVDYETAGVEWLATETQRAIIDELAAHPIATTREIADAVDVSKQHVRGTLARLEERDLVRRHRGTGPYGADEWTDADTATALVDVGPTDAVETANDALCGPSRWSLAIHPRDDRGDTARAGTAGPTTPGTGLIDAAPPPETPD